MKKLILTTLSVIALASYSYGQGEVQIYNSSSASTKIWVNTTASSSSQTGSLLPALSTTGYTFLLFANTTVNPGAGAANVSVSSTPWDGTSGWFSTGDYALNGALAGRIYETDGGNGYVSISQLAVSTYANLELIGWNTAVGGSTLSSFETAYAGALNGTVSGLIFGYSNVANEELGNNSAPQNSNFFSTASGGVSGFTLGNVTSVPEPCTMALLGLGGLSLLVIRRRK